MASSSKKKTTMGKLNRERKLREKRMDKQARKDARRNAPPGSLDSPYEQTDIDVDDVDVEGDEAVDGTDEHGVLEPAAEVGSDA